MNKAGLVTLIGYRGTGKSTVAPLLAEAFGWTSIDSDIEIEHRAGRTIADIFASDGEPVFRQLERQTIVDLLNITSQVLSVGGGAILNAETRRDLKTAGPVIWLTATIDTICERIHGDTMTQQRRPNLTDHTDPREEIAAVLSARQELYADAATHTVATDDRQPEQICDAIIEQIGDLVQHGDKPC